MSIKYRFNLDKKRIWVAGHNGMVGNAILKKLKERKLNTLTVKKSILDLSNQSSTFNWVKKNSPQVIFLAAAKVGGIMANNLNQSEFLYENLMIQNNIIKAAAENQVEKLIFLGSSCIYPKLAKQPILEDSLLTGPLEPTNEAYAIAKIAGVKLCEAYKQQYGFNAISIMPTNLYGLGDNFDLETSHVVPALIRKAHEAKVSGLKRLSVWGTGTPLRELLHVDDLADGLVHLLGVDDPPDWVNLGTGKDQTILELADMVRDVVGFDGDITHDLSKPDGTPIKTLDTSLMDSLGWSASIALREGIEKTYRDYKERLREGTLRL